MKPTHDEIVKRQMIDMNQPRVRLTVVLNDIRSLYNVGSIFRTADGAGVEKIWICGITGRPPQAQIVKTALGAQDHVPWEYGRDVLEVIRDLKSRGLNASYFQNTDHLLEALLKEARNDDVILFMSNGAFDNLPKRLLEKL